MKRIALITACLLSPLSLFAAATLGDATNAAIAVANRPGGILDTNGALGAIVAGQGSPYKFSSAGTNAVNGMAASVRDQSSGVIGTNGNTGAFKLSSAGTNAVQGLAASTTDQTTGVVGTNGNTGAFKFSSGGTNAIKGLAAQNIADSNLVTAATAAANAAAASSASNSLYQAMALSQAKSIHSNNWIDVTFNGAIADSSTPNDAVFYRCYTQAVATGRPIYFPPTVGASKYGITNSLFGKYGFTNRAVTIMGFGGMVLVDGQTTQIPGATIKALADGFPVLLFSETTNLVNGSALTGHDNCVVQNLNFEGFGKTATNSVAIKFAAVAGTSDGVIMDNVSAGNATYAFLVQGGISDCTFTKIILYDSQNGMTITNAVPGYSGVGINQGNWIQVQECEGCSLGFDFAAGGMHFINNHAVLFTNYMHINGGVSDAILEAWHVENRQLWKTAVVDVYAGGNHNLKFANWSVEGGSPDGVASFRNLQPDSNGSDYDFDNCDFGSTTNINGQAVAILENQNGVNRMYSHPRSLLAALYAGTYASANYTTNFWVDQFISISGTPSAANYRLGELVKDISVQPPRYYRVTSSDGSYTKVMSEIVDTASRLFVNTNSFTKFNAGLEVSSGGSADSGPSGFNTNVFKIKGGGPQAWPTGVRMVGRIYSNQINAGGWATGYGSLGGWDGVTALYANGPSADDTPQYILEVWGGDNSTRLKASLIVTNALKVIGTATVSNIIQTATGQSIPIPIIEAGKTNGTAVTALTILFPFSMPNTNYTVSVSGNGAAIASLVISAKTTNSFSTTMVAFTGNIDWSVIQQLP